MNVLFVCRGNVGRSQMAEAIFAQLTAGKHSVGSAGIEAYGDEGKDLDGMPLKDRKSSMYVIESLKEIGIDVSGNTIKRLTPAMIKNTDKIFIMTKQDGIPDFLKTSEKVVYWDIEDPDGQTLETHRKVRDEIGKLVRAIIKDGIK